MNQMYGFEGEVKAKYSAQMFQLFSEVFQWLPLAMCVNQRVLVSDGLQLPACRSSVVCLVPDPCVSSDHARGSLLGGRRHLGSDPEY